MKLISLNLWGGKAFDPLMDFLKRSALTTDIFCFQEVFSAPAPRILENGAHTYLLSELSVALSDFEFFFASVQDGWAFGKVDFDVSFGQCIAVKRNTGTAEYREQFVCSEKNGLRFDDSNRTMPRVIQGVTLTASGKTYAVCNFHGIATWPKTDTPERFAQSRKIREFLVAVPGEKVLCGDFNLSPGTESVRMLAEGMRNPVGETGVVTTRSRLCPFANAPAEISDYVFLSPDITVRSFSVPDIGVSDHLPLVLEFS